MPLDSIPGDLPHDNAELAGLPRNDAGNARRLIARHGSEMAWVPEIGWLVWDGHRWASDGGDEAAYNRAEATAEAIYDEADELPGEAVTGADGKTRPSRRQGHRNWAVTCGNVARCSSMLKAASSRLRRRPGDFDAQHWLLNVPNGTIELGDKVVLRGHRPSDRLTKMAAIPYDPQADCPDWNTFMDTILPDRETQLFVQKWLGHNLTGDISEQLFIMLDGKGSNGKSTMMEVVARIMGDYSDTVPIESFLHTEGRKGSEASPDLACLRGARLIRTSEPQPGSRLSETRIKQWTGGEPVKARELQKKFMTFIPDGKITMSCNIRPHIAGKDDGIKTRILVVPFKHRFARRGGGRKEQYVDRMVRNEGPGILRWLLDGFRMWHEDGLAVPTEVRLATDDMFAEQDPIGTAMRDLLVEPEPGVSREEADKRGVFAAQLYKAYVMWSERHGEEPKKLNSVGRRMKDLGYRKKHTRGGTMYVGVTLNEEYREAAQ